MLVIGRCLRWTGYLICGLVLAGGILGIQVSDAATYYVATTGSDSNPGTETSPFRTLNKGVTVLKPGDTLYLRGGVYAESLRNKIAGGTSWGAPVKVAAFPGERVTLKPSSGTHLLWLSGSERQYIIIEGFILDAGGVSSNGIKIDSSDGTPATAAHHIRIQNVEVKNAPNQGIHVSPYCDNNEFINLNVHHNGRDAKRDHGIYIVGSRNLVDGGEWHHNKEFGIQLYRSGTGNIVRNARIYANNQGMVSSQQNGNLIMNNLVYQNTENGIVLMSGNNLKLYNNTIYNNGQNGIYLTGSNVKNAQVRNNIAFGNTANIRNKGLETTLSNNLTTDPQFIDAALHDFRLHHSSPAIDSGVTLSEVKSDFANVNRPQGVAYDIGAYEYTGSTSSALLLSPKNVRVINANKGANSQR